MSNFWTKLSNRINRRTEFPLSEWVKRFADNRSQPVIGPGRSAPDSIPAKLSEGGVLLSFETWAEWIDTTQPDDRWKLKLRVLRLLLQDRRDLHAENGDGLVASGLMMAMNYVDDMLGESEEEMVR